MDTWVGSSFGQLWIIALYYEKCMVEFAYNLHVNFNVGNASLMLSTPVNTKPI